MRHANNEWRKTTHDRRIGTTISRKIWTLAEKEIYKYLGILEAETIKQVEMKDTTKKGDLRRTRKLLEKKNLYRRNFIKGINASAVTLIRYSGPF